MDARTTHCRGRISPICFLRIKPKFNCKEVDCMLIPTIAQDSTRSREARISHYLYQWRPIAKSVSLAAKTISVDLVR